MPEQARAEAAVWLAKLHSDTRSPQTEAGFRRWIAANPSHGIAFERMTCAWEATGGLHRAPRQGALSRNFWRVFHGNMAVLAATFAVCALVSIGTLYLMRSDLMSHYERLTTKLGERRAIVLPDGSHLVLNTDSRVTVAFSSKAREVILERGQARFEVAREPDRPFVVRAGDQQIVATGTAFDVRWTDGRLCVVLVEGHLAILPASAPVAAVPSAALTLHASERVEFRGRAKPVKSRARVEREEAWTTGHVIFESTPLSTAVAEMNRYAPQQLELGDPSLARLLISGTFSVGDSRDFARAVAQVFSLQIAARPNAIVLEPASLERPSKEISAIQ